VKRTLSLKACATSIVVLMTLAAASEFSMGRRLWGINGKPGLWSGDIWSNHNSQYLTDPYSFTHITHGILLYGVLRVFTNTSPASMRLIVAVGLESAWEVLENTDLVIQRYRAETISLNYYGDSILNSMGDIATCMLGFLLALRLPKRVTIIGTLVLEIVLLVWIRDNLSLNILMLIRPTRSIRMWQLGK